MILKPINAEDLLFANDSVTSTQLLLRDYDWMNYKLKTEFKTKTNNSVRVIFEFCGASKSVMEVCYYHTDEFYEKVEGYRYEFDSKLYEKYIKLFLERHINAWDKEQAFSGEDIVLDFYNQVLAVGNLTLHTGTRLRKKFS